MSALYVFALTNESAPPLNHGDRRIEFIGIRGIHAAVERAAHPPDLSEDALRAQHQIVLKIARQVDAIIPARFGAWLDRDELEMLVSMRIGPIKEALAVVTGRVQMTVRVFTGEGSASATERVATRHDGAGMELIRGAFDKGRTGAAYLDERRQQAAPPLTGPELNGS